MDDADGPTVVAPDSGHRRSMDNAAGWYPDPWRQAPLRWWDGTQWHAATTAPHGVSFPTPPDAAAKLRQQRSWGAWHRRLVVVTPVVLFLFALVYGLFGRSLTTLAENLDQPFPESPPPAIIWVQLSSVVLSPLTIGALVVRLGWFSHAVGTARALGRHTRRDVALATVGWLIPVVNLWWPCQDVRDLTPEGDPARKHLGWWWACYLSQGFAFVPPFFGGVFGAPVALIVALAVLATIPAAMAALLERSIVQRVLDSHERRLAEVRAPRPAERPAA